MICLTGIYNIFLFVSIECIAPHLVEMCGHGLPISYLYQAKKFLYMILLIGPIQIHTKREIGFNSRIINYGINIACFLFIFNCEYNLFGQNLI